MNDIESKEPCTEPKICPKCQRIMNYDSWFGQMMCRQCGHMEEVELKVITTEDEILENNSEQKEIINYTLLERQRQDTKWGEQNHSADKWGMIIAEEFGEMCQAINEFGFKPSQVTEDKIKVEAIQTMASCMAMLECMARSRKAD